MPIVAVDLSAGDDARYTVDQRAIFAFGGGLNLRADPIGIEQRYSAALAAQHPDAIRRWLREKTLNHRLLAFRRLVPIALTALGVAPLDPRTGAGLTGNEALAVLDRFSRFRDELTARFRVEAEFLATYPAVAAPPLAYEAFVGLWWNRRRVQAIAGANQYRAATAAAGAPLDFALADAMAETLDEAYLIEEQIENNRLEAESRAQHWATQGRG